jgi:hypothetical protein
LESEGGRTYGGTVIQDLLVAGVILNMMETRGTPESDTS